MDIPTLSLSFVQVSFFNIASRRALISGKFLKAPAISEQVLDSAFIPSLATCAINGGGGLAPGLTVGPEMADQGVRATNIHEKYLASGERTSDW